MAIVKLGSIHYTAFDNTGTLVSQGSRSSTNVHRDLTLEYKALEFRDAAERDGRLFVCALVPKWKRPLLKLLNIPVEK